MNSGHTISHRIGVSSRYCGRNLCVKWMCYLGTCFYFYYVYHFGSIFFFMSYPTKCKIFTEFLQLPIWCFFFYSNTTFLKLKCKFFNYAVIKFLYTGCHPCHIGSYGQYLLIRQGSRDTLYIIIILIKIVMIKPPYHLCRWICC